MLPTPWSWWMLTPMSLSGIPPLFEHAATDDLLGLALDGEVDPMGVQIAPAQLSGEVSARVAERVGHLP
jgi:hypothetical protein